MQATVASHRPSTRRKEKVGDREATREAILLLELAIARCRASGLAGEETKARICEALKETKRELLRLEERDGERAGLGLILGGRSTTDTERPRRRGGRRAR